MLGRRRPRTLRMLVPCLDNVLVVGRESKQDEVHSAFFALSSRLVTVFATSLQCSICSRSHALSRALLWAVAAYKLRQHVPGSAA